MSENGYPTIAVPPPPASLEACGVPLPVLQDLLLKHLHPRGMAAAEELNREFRLPRRLLDELLATLDQDGLIHPEPQTPEGVIRYRPTTSGRNRACDAFAVSRYLGPVPVALPDYVEQCRKQRFDGSGITADDLTQALTGVVLDDATHHELQLAASSGGAMLLTGESGNGKSLVASRLAQLVEQSSEAIYVPYAIWTGESCLRIFDPTVHHPLDTITGNGATSSDHFPEADARWRKVRRPAILRSVDLTHDDFRIAQPATAACPVAPFQVLANGGILILDDLGRQSVPLVELMNRWILPLEDQADIFTTAPGRRVTLPVDAWLVFVAGPDAPALPTPVVRRITTHVELPAPERDRFSAILLEEARRRRIEVEEGAVDELFASHYSPQNPPKCCDPKNLLQGVEALCRFQKETVRARTDLLMAVAHRLRSPLSRAA